MTRKYIVVSSEYGSAARLMVKPLAEQLGMKFYNEDALLIKAAKESGIDEKVFRSYDEMLTNCMVDGVVRPELIAEFSADLPMRIYQAYAAAILHAVEEGPCILMERLSDQVLRGKVDFLNVFVYSANMKKKIERAITIAKISEQDALPHIISNDMQRKIYHNSFSNSEWGEKNEYDLCLNIDTLGHEKCAEIIKASL